MKLVINTNTCNVLQLAAGFFLIFSAFNTQSFIEESVLNSYAEEGKIEKHDGYTSLALIYASFTVLNFLAPPIIELIGTRWALVFGAATYAIFEAGFLFINKPYLYGSSILLGLGAAVIWTAQGKYLSLNCTEETAGRNSCIFWAISQTSLSFGGLFMFILFKTSAHSEGHDFSDSTVKTIYGVFTAVTVIGLVILSTLRLPSWGFPAGLPLQSANGATEDGPVTYREVLKSTWKLAQTPRMMVMSIVFMYSGIQLSFWSGIYPTSIASTLALDTDPKSLLALNAIALGIGQIVFGAMFLIFDERLKRIGRARIVFFGTVILWATFSAIYVNIPAGASLSQTSEKAIIKPNVVLALLCGFFLGFGDSCWNTQIFSFLITKYPNKSTQAFSLLKFFQSLLTCAAFFYSRILSLHWHLLILLIGSAIACTSFFIVDRKSRSLATSKSIKKNDQ